MANGILLENFHFFAFPRLACLYAEKSKMMVDDEDEDDDDELNENYFLLSFSSATNTTTANIQWNPKWKTVRHTQTHEM